MNNQQLKELEAELWGSADNLRANSKLTAAEYKDPVLGLILLRYAQNRFDKVEELIKQKRAQSRRRRSSQRELTKDDFIGANAIFLQNKSRYDYLVRLAEGEGICEAVNNAMELIEKDYPKLQGVLPKNYEDLGEILLIGLVRVFNRDKVKNLTGDVFGRIYEFFLMKFSMTGAGAQEGGEFFTPPSLVQLIVNLIQPNHGIVYDPACGSGGMFVQTGHFLEERGETEINKAIRVYGVELKKNNVRLAKMNLAIHGIDGEIIESNSFDSDPHNLIGQCDFVMANPPFNVKKVDKSKDYVKQDKRLFADIGIPKADNGNYLWIQYFYHYLNAKGRAGFVMASSATDAGNTEKAIRQRLVETGAVDCIISVANNFFYTLSLPCHVWFLDRGKSEANKDKVLMIDARNTFRKVNTTLNDFSDGQLINLSAMMAGYREDTEAISKALLQHQQNVSELAQALCLLINQLRAACCEKMDDDSAMDAYFKACLHDLRLPCELEISADVEQVALYLPLFESPVSGLQRVLSRFEASLVVQKAELKELEALKKLKKSALSAVDKVRLESLPKRKKAAAGLNAQVSSLSGCIKDYQDEAKDLLADFKQAILDWRQLVLDFPDAVFADVEGLCKVVDLAEIKENDWSLTPGRYVGYRLQIDEDFDYQRRMTEIHAELKVLNAEANGFMEQILGFDL